ncbi:hypothetical protein [Pedobacter nyackensis]|uniref:hypothetical protein n=1 Tax=Pedobacter nyackensis TaxID=475255 RepID=UPI00293183AA|nr:hypothetical protein [Pedobacter nyackensis]
MLTFLKKLFYIFVPLEETPIRKIFKNHTPEQVLVAHHEAGHIMGALYLGIEVKNCQIYLNQSGQWEGKTEYNYGYSKPYLELMIKIKQGKDVLTESNIQPITKAGIIRYSVAIAGPIAELKHINGSSIDDLETYRNGSDKDACWAVIDFFKQTGLHKPDMENDFRSHIVNLFDRPHSWEALQTLACRILTANNHQISPSEIKQIIQPKHLLI